MTRRNNLRAAEPINTARRVPVTVTWPEGVKVQQCPCGTDERWRVDPATFAGGALMADWHARRAAPQRRAAGSGRRVAK